MTKRREDYLRSGKNNESRGQSLLKIEFYILSLRIMFILAFILTVDIPISFAPDAKFIGFGPLIKRNWVAIISLLMVFVSWIISLKLEYWFKGAHNPVAKIISIKNENYEHLTFLTTYIIPLICINLGETRYVIVLVILLIIIGKIYVKMDLYLGNPTLALQGYHLYRIEANGFSSTDGILVISKDKLSIGSSIKWIKITDSIWVVKENQTK